MPDAGVRIEGLAAMNRALERFPKATQRGAVRGMRKGVNRVQRAARKHPPMPVKTGRLRASIATRVQPVGQMGVRGIIGSKVKYAPHQEFGTKRGVRPKYYLRGAMQQEVHNVVSDMAQEIEIEIRKLARR